MVPCGTPLRCRGECCTVFLHIHCGLPSPRWIKLMDSKIIHIWLTLSSFRVHPANVKRFQERKNEWMTRGWVEIDVLQASKSRLGRVHPGEVGWFCANLEEKRLLLDPFLRESLKVRFGVYTRNPLEIGELESARKKRRISTRDFLEAIQLLFLPFDRIQSLTKFMTSLKDCSTFVIRMCQVKVTSLLIFDMPHSSPPSPEACPGLQCFETNVWMWYQTDIRNHSERG